MALRVASARPGSVNPILRIVAGVALVSCITFLDSRVFGVNSATAILSYLLAILALAIRWGLLVSIVSSVAATLWLNFFFLPPVGTFTIADPQNWIALITFLGTGITVSHLSARAKQRTQEALYRQQEMERLYELGRSLMLTDPRQSLSDQIARLISATFGLTGAAYFDRQQNKVTRFGDIPLADDQLRSVASEGTVFQDWRNQVIAMPVSLGGIRLGSVGFAGTMISDSAAYAVSNLLAITLERHRAQQVAVRADMARQNQEFKATLLDAVAHEFKTPLTAIKAAVTTLAADRAGPESEFLSVIDEETDRLTEIVTEAMETSRLEAGGLAINRRPFPVEELIERATVRLRGILEGRPFTVQIAPDLPLLSVDPDLASIALQQLLSNAANYSTPDKPIVLAGVQEDNRVVLSVTDHGPGIPEREQSLIFERFYRGSEVRERTTGTGMGLAIAREIARGHGGDLAVESQPGHGSVFSLTLPTVKNASDDESFSLNS